jgi:hypothetical protein
MVFNKSDELHIFGSTRNTIFMNVFKMITDGDSNGSLRALMVVRNKNHAKSLPIVRLSCFAIVRCRSYGMVWSSVTCAGNGFTSNARILRHFQMKVNGFVEHVDLQAIETLININIYKKSRITNWFSLSILVI